MTCLKSQTCSPFGGFRNTRNFCQPYDVSLRQLIVKRKDRAIRRDKLLEVLQSFLDEPELRMIRFLLAATSFEPRLSTGDCHAFASTIGTPQGDSLSPVLFTVYLEAALRDLRSRLPSRPPADDRLPLDVEYADDIDSISYSRPYLNEIERIVPACLAEWSLQINAAKTDGPVSADRWTEYSSHDAPYAN